MPMVPGGFYPASGAACWRASLRQVALYAVIVFLAGCASSTETSRINMSGFSAGFKQGYSDGCESASTRAQRRNESRYKTETDYMMGWNDGYSACRGR